MYSCDWHLERSEWERAFWRELNLRNVPEQSWEERERMFRSTKESTAWKRRCEECWSLEATGGVRSWRSRAGSSCSSMVGDLEKRVRRDWIVR